MSNDPLADARDMNVEGDDQLAGLRPVRAYRLRTAEWGGIHPARRCQPAQAGLKPRRGLKAAPHSCRAPNPLVRLWRTGGSAAGEGARPTVSVAGMPPHGHGSVPASNRARKQAGWRMRKYS